jgi:hypothetical protein
MEKYGFVYIWFDRKHYRFYIGSHWGNETDSYICSSIWMKRAYKRRPNDFRRKILEKVFTDKKDLLEKENIWLAKIKKCELKNRYYNLTNYPKNHWSADPDKAKTISEKLKISHNRPEFKAKAREQKLGDKNPMKRPEVIAKRAKSMENVQIIPWNKGLDKSDERIKLGCEKMRAAKTKEPWNKGMKTGKRWRRMNKEDQYKLIAERNSQRRWFHDPVTKQKMFVYLGDEGTVPTNFVYGRGPRR